jgi:uncharacterized protein (TIGR00730 family)
MFISFTDPDTRHVRTTTNGQSPLQLQSICVFCGSNAGRTPAYAEAATALGETLGRAGIRVIYGGGSVGLMGAVASAAMRAGGEVIGVIPHALDRREIADRSITELRVVETMHERKALMAELSDGFIALPGGLGTFEELFEVLTWAQLGIHAKPVGLLDVAGYYDALFRFLDHAVAEEFLRPIHLDLLVHADTVDELLDRMRSHVPPAVEKWLALEQR